MFENSSPDGLGLVLNTNKPYLGDLNVVDNLVRKFSGFVIETRKKQNEGLLTDDEAASAVIGKSEEYGDIFMGKNDNFSPMKWNSERRMGIVLRTQYPQYEGMNSATAAFVWLANQVLTAAVDMEMGADEKDTFQQLTEILQQFGRFLVGAHLPAGATET